MKWLRKWIKAFKNGHTNVRDEGQHGRSFVITIWCRKLMLNHHYLMDFLKFQEVFFVKLWQNV